MGAQLFSSPESNKNVFCLCVASRKRIWLYPPKKYVSPRKKCLKHGTAHIPTNKDGRTTRNAQQIVWGHYSYFIMVANIYLFRKYYVSNNNTFHKYFSCTTPLSCKSQFPRPPSPRTPYQRSRMMKNHDAVGLLERPFQGPCKPDALILSPTRELCLQIYDEASKFCHKTAFRLVRVYGQESASPPNR